MLSAACSLLGPGENLPIPEEILLQTFDITEILDDNPDGYTVLFNSEYSATLFLLRFS
jgi:hypothetical protein